MTRSTFRCVTAAALGLAAAAPLQAHAQDIQSATIEVANRGTAADLLTPPSRPGRTSRRPTSTVPAGVNPNLAPPPSSGSPTGYNDPSLGFNSTQYWAKDAQYSGVTRLIITYDTRNVTTGVTGTASFLCSGALINAGKSVLTAGHCLNNSVEGGVEFTLRTVQVQLGQNFGGNTTAEPGAGAPSVNQAFNFVQDVGPDGVRIHPDYSGSVIDQRDIAVVNLNTPAPSLYRSYELYAGTGIGEEFNVAGWGGRGNGDLGTVNAAGSTGSGQRIRQGLNRFDISYASDKWSTAFTNLITGARGPQDVYLADFDNGLAANDALCQLSFATIGGAPIWLGTDAERPLRHRASVSARWARPAATRAARRSSAAGFRRCLVVRPDVRHGLLRRRPPRAQLVVRRAERHDAGRHQRGLGEQRRRARAGDAAAVRRRRGGPGGRRRPPPARELTATPAGAIAGGPGIRVLPLVVSALTAATMLTPTRSLGAQELGAVAPSACTREFRAVLLPVRDGS
jgi:hypothetical protein